MDTTIPRIGLDFIGAMHGTNKSSHGFLNHYERLFEEFRDQTFNMIEFGVERGQSLATWQDYFQNATIIGVDIKESCRQFQRNRAVVEIGSQDDPGFLSDLAHRYPPHIVIDDASHMAHHIIFTFERLFPSLAAGGLYIVEDLHYHTGATLEITRGYADVLPVDYFGAVARSITLTDHQPELQWGLQGYLRKHIDEITFFGRGLAVRKKAPEARRDERNAQALQFAERDGTAEAWELASQYLQRNGDLNTAIVAMRNAIQIRPRARLYNQLGLLHRSRGDRRSALEAAQMSMQHPGEPPELSDCYENYGDLLGLESRFDEALKAYRDALLLIEHPAVRDRIEVKIKKIVERPAA